VYCYKQAQTKEATRVTECQPGAHVNVSVYKVYCYVNHAVTS